MFVLSFHSALHTNAMVTAPATADEFEKKDHILKCQGHSLASGALATHGPVSPVPDLPWISGYITEVKQLLY